MNQGLFHHDAVQLANGIAVNNRIGMLYLYHFTGFYIIPAVLSLASVIAVYLIGNFIFNKGEKLAMLFSLIPPFMSISLYPNSNLPQFLLMLISFYLFMRKQILFSVIALMISLLFRTEAIFLLIIYAIEMLRNGRNKLSKAFVLLFLLLSPLLFWQRSNSDLSINAMVLLLLVLSVGIIPLLLMRKGIKIYLFYCAIMVFPFIFVATVKARMIIFPLFLLILAVVNLKNVNYYFIPMVLISINLMFAYAYYDSVDDLITKQNLCRDIEFYDYSVFFEYYGSDSLNCNYNADQKVLLFHQSSIFPNIQRISIVNKTVSLSCCA